MRSSGKVVPIEDQTSQMFFDMCDADESGILDRKELAEYLKITEIGALNQ